jgi:hypothetical protein
MHLVETSVFNQLHNCCCWRCRFYCVLVHILTNVIEMAALQYIKLLSMVDHHSLNGWPKLVS